MHPGVPPARRPGILFVANGAGDLRGTSEGACAAVTAAGLPWEVKTVRWSIGPLSLGLLDLKSRHNHAIKGRLLAQEVACYRKAHPGHMICLVGHSAGCAVVLAAAEQLPPGCVDHVVLLSPAVSAHYDLRPALRTVRCGINVYCSRKDRFLLALQPIGASDRYWAWFAGLTGFTPVTSSEDDQNCCARLSHYFWGPDMAYTGHTGGHFGNTRPDFLRDYVFPLLLEKACWRGG
jgi:pimeloyl-ACP methyl ester carboxylesterase